jgi:hypothetical protein
MCRALAVDLEKLEPEDYKPGTVTAGGYRGIPGSWRYLMTRISRMVIAAAAIATLLGGLGAAAVAAVPTLTAATAAATHGTNGTVPICNPTAVEYGVPVCPST